MRFWHSVFVLTREGESIAPVAFKIGGSNSESAVADLKDIIAFSADAVGATMLRQFVIRRGIRIVRIFLIRACPPLWFSIPTVSCSGCGFFTITHRALQARYKKSLMLLEN